MIDLKPYAGRVEEFLTNSIAQFEQENGQPSAIGIYCCPWSGWLCINFNKTKSLSEVYNNCPDFEFVEYDLIDFDEWQEEYEEGSYDDDGDEKFNEIFFRFLEPIAANVKKQTNKTVLLQMLDSSFIKEF